MHLAFTLIAIFFLVFSGFALGFEVGIRTRIDQRTPWNIIKPRFRLIYKNPKTHDLKKSR